MHSAGKALLSAACQQPALPGEVEHRLGRGRGLRLWGVEMHSEEAAKRKIERGGAFCKEEAICPSGR